MNRRTGRHSKNGSFAALRAIATLAAALVALSLGAGAATFARQGPATPPPPDAAPVTSLAHLTPSQR